MHQLDEGNLKNGRSVHASYPDLPKGNQYRLVDKYMCQSCLMKFNIDNIDENYLSSDIVFIVLAYFLNLMHPSLKCAIYSFLIDTIQNLLQGLKKLILVSHLNPFEFFFHCKKQVEVTGGQIRQTGWTDVACGAYHILRVNLLKFDLCELNNCRDESRVISDAAPFFEERSLVQIELVCLLQNIRCSF
jgi:hypothetical protein